VEVVSVVVVVVVAAVVVVEIHATDVKNQAILHVIVLNQIHVVIQINKVVMMIIRKRTKNICMNSLCTIKQCSYFILLVFLRFVLFFFCFVVYLTKHDYR